MGEKARYLVAVLAAGTAFVASGGIHAAEKAIQAEEGARKLGVEATIPFVNHGGIRDWHPDGLEALYIQDAQGRWYHATLMGPCFDLNGTEAVAFLTRGPDQLDKYSSISVRGRRCPFSSLVTSAPPPKKAKGSKESTEASATG
jgi:hypothetical protein